MSEAYFWGLSLDGEKASESWNPELESEEGKQVSYRGDHILNIKQAVLGGSAKPGEVNVVEVEVMGFQGSLKLPVVRLQSDTVPQTQLDLSFPDPPVKFTLVQGKGPIHLIGNLAISNPIDDALDCDDEFEEEDFDEDEIEDNKKMVADDDEDEEEFDEEMPKKKVKNSGNMVKQVKGTPLKKRK